MLFKGRKTLGGQSTMDEKIGILHPGQMGISVAASARKSGATVLWVSDGRSPETRGRAESQDLVDCESLEALCRTCSMIISVCPPHAAETLADQVLAAGFRGLYLDANAIAPQRVRRMATRMEAQGIVFVDGGIIGGPAWEPGQTWLYLSGQGAEWAGACFPDGPLETQVVGTEPGQASALKMCFAAYTKGRTALLCAILAAAEDLGVRSALETQWSRQGSDFADQAHRRARGVTAKAWRFAGEMEEIAATFESSGMPAGFHQAAADVYRRMAHFKGMDPLPSLDAVLSALLKH
jgi:3-hydroxyisobutyrate dehydrogenase-like beta-hydroxyacid dehydrogenase